MSADFACMIYWERLLHWSQSWKTKIPKSISWRTAWNIHSVCSILDNIKCEIETLLRAWLSDIFAWKVSLLNSTDCSLSMLLTDTVFVQTLCEAATFTVTSAKFAINNCLRINLYSVLKRSLQVEVTTCHYFHSSQFARHINGFNLWFSTIFLIYSGRKTNQTVLVLLLTPWWLSDGWKIPSSAPAVMLIPLPWRRSAETTIRLVSCRIIKDWLIRPSTKSKKTSATLQLAQKAQHRPPPVWLQLLAAAASVKTAFNGRRVNYLESCENCRWEAQVWSREAVFAGSSPLHPLQTQLVCYLVLVLVATVWPPGALREKKAYPIELVIV